MKRKLLGRIGKTVGFCMALTTALHAVPNDFNGDGTSDILWNKDHKGYVIWCMKNGRKDSEILLPTRTARWKVAQTGDYDGDGFTDILWQKPDGGSQIWLMSGLDVKEEIDLSSDRAWSAEPADRNFEPINDAMLAGKRFYFAEREDESNIVEYYKVKILDRQTMRLHHMKIDRSNGQVLEDDRARMRYRIVNGVVLVNDGDGINRLTLIRRTADQWYVRAEYDDGPVGAFSQESKVISSWFLRKPARYPDTL